jgi:hypothetical protein
MQYWLPPTKEFLPATGCKRSEVVETPYMTPYRKWDCPSSGMGQTTPTLLRTHLVTTIAKARDEGDIVIHKTVWPYYVAGGLGIVAVGVVGYMMFRKKGKGK